ncbi:MAG: SDR family oxidoreductase [Betaproteobacteria bacterium]|nr:SDR family oxidoreductase [Betaproteobacteria bacterium]NBQ78318.1 SDR family oxidoreductase [Betaproteobacteria bacterium]NBQ94840.1 SDR family oxidoreductase [Betaproteobacteria bacterium]NDE46025.1 SDR family oxidoreductase [Betaproteobacteria bacterium]
MSDGGRIVALTTSLIRHPLAGLGPYSASKAAVECLIRSLAKALAPRSILVNALAPGPVDTKLFRSGKTEEAKAKSAAMSPMHRIGQAHEIADVLAFPLSPQATWVDGQVIQANGGLV